MQQVRLSIGDTRRLYMEPMGIPASLRWYRIDAFRFYWTTNGMDIAYQREAAVESSTQLLQNMHRHPNKRDRQQSREHQLRRGHARSLDDRNSPSHTSLKRRHLSQQRFAVILEEGGRQPRQYCMTGNPPMESLICNARDPPHLFFFTRWQAFTGQLRPIAWP